jgi:lipopolysaccharide transport system ATP-binding protein
MSESAVRLEQVGKMYKIFNSRSANLKDALGLPSIRKARFNEFWALRGIDLDLAVGERVGVVGRNGAGKTTLMKLVTQNVAPTEGRMWVNGQVQALMDAGAGFHPEFTGVENIRAALTLQGVSSRGMAAAVEEITDFTELGAFIDQPFRTYSAGMQARLAFATATAVEPEILIVDEMLSAGDAYFSAKAAERMKGLVEGGTSLLLVSHSLEHITMFCPTAIWLDRGRIVKAGPSLDVVKAYQQFTRVLDERRLQAKNQKARSGEYLADQLESYADSILLRLTLRGDGAAQVHEVVLHRDGEPEERVRVGDAQDADTSHAAFVVLAGGSWSGPLESDRGMARALAGGDGSSGCAEFNLYGIFEEARYALDVTYRLEGAGTLVAELLHEGHVKASLDLAPTGDAWATARLEVAGRRLKPAHVGAELVGGHESVAAEAARTDTVKAFHAAEEAGRNGGGAGLSRWPGEGSVVIKDVRLVDETGQQRAVFDRASSLTVAVTVEAVEAGEYPLTAGISVYRIDGLLVSNHAGPEHLLPLEPGTEARLLLEFDELNLGDGGYTVSVALFRVLDPHGQSQVYDLIDRSYEFQVVGSEPFSNGVFDHPARWSVESPVRR